MGSFTYAKRVKAALLCAAAFVVLVYLVVAYGGGLYARWRTIFGSADAEARKERSTWASVGPVAVHEECFAETTSRPPRSVRSATATTHDAATAMAEVKAVLSRVVSRSGGDPSQIVEVSGDPSVDLLYQFAPGPASADTCVCLKLTASSAGGGFIGDRASHYKGFYAIKVPESVVYADTKHNGGLAMERVIDSTLSEHRSRTSAKTTP